jgi:hypothetical protein
VESIGDSLLYLRFVMGEVTPEALARSPDRHIRCHPEVAQFIIDDKFPAQHCDGLFAKSGLDSAFVAAEERRVTRGWRRLQEVLTLSISIDEYPLPEVRAAWGR